MKPFHILTSGGKRNFTSSSSGRRKKTAYDAILWLWSTFTTHSLVSCPLSEMRTNPIGYNFQWTFRFSSSGHFHCHSLWSAASNYTDWDVQCIECIAFFKPWRGKKSFIEGFVDLHAIQHFSKPIVVPLLVWRVFSALVEVSQMKHGCKNFSIKLPHITTVRPNRQLGLFFLLLLLLPKWISVQANWCGSVGL